MGAALIEAVVIKGILAGVAALPAQFDTDLDIFGMISHGTAPFGFIGSNAVLAAVHHEIARPILPANIRMP